MGLVRSTENGTRLQRPHVYALADPTGGDERHGEEAVMPLLTQLQEVLTPLVQRPAAECEEVANALEQVAIERRRAALEVGGEVSK